MKYKVGDIVKVKSDLHTSNSDYYTSDQHNSVVPGMLQYAGKTVKVIRNDGSAGYRLEGCDSYNWTDAMLEDVTQSQNYLCLNGKRVDLTEEQLRTLGIEPEKKSPFARAKHGEMYYFINAIGNIDDTIDCETSGDNARFERGNYCTDEKIMKQRALKHELMDKLEAFAIENGGIPERGLSIFYTIQSNPSGGYRVDDRYCTVAAFEPRFASREIAQRAVDEIATPFLAAHPDFAVC